ncbi:MAG: hypothetical protein KKD66_23095 [Proteobacteria bacterium]|nr:hypothetical protein [Pseudomonadota bacterium]MBU2452921.1 hypothetical protein [Pseudomonadota bacterium]MBU2627511.1 hypothetical protein [Pseudomonadota bacterium]
MKILTPVQSALSNVEKKISPSEMLALQEQLIQAYAAGFYAADPKPTAKKIQSSIEGSNLYREIRSPELETWFNEQKKS